MNRLRNIWQIHIINGYIRHFIRHILAPDLLLSLNAASFENILYKNRITCVFLTNTHVKSTYFLFIALLLYAQLSS